MRRERGVALLTAMLVVALATVAAVAMTARQQHDLRRTANLLEADQIQLYLQGMETWAGEVLLRDRRDGEADHLGESWATLLPPVTVDNGQLTGRMEDLQGRFNLNGLVQGGQTDAVALARFRRLLALLELDPDLAGAVVDWIDPDPDAGLPAGAEDNTYLARQPPYRSANRPMADASELMLVAGFDATAWRALAPFVTALPGPAVINLNTAPPLVLAALADDLAPAEVEAFVHDRQDRPYTRLADALQHPLFAGRGVETAGLGVGSHHFALIAHIRFGRLQQRHHSLLQRNDQGAVTVLARSRADL